ncbi:hypothetical protein WG622_03555 [Cognatishimia sp. D5M38]|uniref:Uncharacterized protein n=1 Tax=Cognatishimia coralii TaxID=3083254 RepID=A0ABU8QD28_9RHOB
MQTISNGYQALGVLWAVNWERFLFPAVMLVCLSVWHYVGSQGFFWH